jgi:hypothetical protein
VIVSRLIPAGVFVAIFVAHALYLGFSAESAPSGWTDFNMSANAGGPLGLGNYWRGQDYFIGFSYALGAAFAAWAFSRCITFRRGRIVTGGAAVGGLTLVGVLMASGCFLIGCCGSPMLAVYVSLFGAKALGVGKPLTALVTLVSVGCAYCCLSRSPPERGACADPCCPPAGTPQEIAGTDRSEGGKTTQEQSPHDQNRSPRPLNE